MTALATLRNQLRNELKVDKNGKIWADSVLDTSLNIGYSKIQRDGGYNWQQNAEEYTVSSVSGTQEYVLPSDFIRLELLLNGADQLVKSSLIQRKKVNVNFSSGNPLYYYIRGANFGFDPIPDTGKTITMYYRKKLPILTSSQDSELPDDFDDAIVKYAAYTAWANIKGNEQTAEKKLQEYGRRQQDLFSSYVFEDYNSLNFGVSRGATTLRDNVLSR